MKKMLIAGNWKMNTTSKESKALIEMILERLSDLGRLKSQVLVCPPFTSLMSVSDVLRGFDVFLGAQNCHFQAQGAYTGEISLPMLKQLKCDYVIIGHSERRTYFFETDEIINKKIKAAISANIVPILCIGETLQERQEGSTFSVLERQLSICFKDITPEQLKQMVIAYEPVWAIGTGLAATPEQAQEAHYWIRSYLNDNFSGAAEDLILLYGGSLTPDNADDILSLPDINGGLIGGASLKPDSFISIIKTAEIYL
ncbi:MAG: triosephosphate isomerase [Bacteroidota bacterium]|nr:triosephosphate isomerase [Bacteroidota bacterium]